MSTNWTIEKYKAVDLADKIKNKKIKVPHYQRGQVWKEKQKEKLIDSIKLGYPFGSILLYKNEDNTYQLIDGLQRVSTIYEYLHAPAKFFRKADISDEGIEQIFQLLNLKDNEGAIKDKILNYIQTWVLENHKTMEEVKHIKASNCALYLQKQFPTCSNDAVISIIKILEDEFDDFQKDCEILANMEVPAIVYEGDASSLPEVFNRINSKGTTLSKYQILSATWTAYEYNLTAIELNPIFEYVDKFYVSILNDQFEIEGYNHTDINESGRLNFYQIMYGFSKLLSNIFPYLFTKSSKKEGVESSGFNLVNCCLGNKNNNIAELPKILNNTFNDDKQINDFLVNIIQSTNDIYKLLKPYLEFKLNRRDSIEIYHSEFQICSMIANYFNNKYVTYSYDDKGNIIGRNIETKETNKSFKIFQKDFKNNAFKKYLIDIIEDNWKGSGDSKMDRIALDKNYYSSKIDANT
ncbi:MAG: DUF262 domain-containing protein, partial [Erysipelotrichaceae bacterium]|nr:DUF262 domain-containing protein [Erysipelotrichaceae bacterium]